jgi:hypothetical protein
MYQQSSAFHPFWAGVNSDQQQVVYAVVVGALPPCSIAAATYAHLAADV